MFHCWCISNVRDMTRMFYGAHSFVHDISNWNMSKVTNKDEMFDDSEYIRQQIKMPDKI